MHRLVVDRKNNRGRGSVDRRIDLVDLCRKARPCLLAASCVNLDGCRCDYQLTSKCRHYIYT